MKSICITFFKQSVVALSLSILSLSIGCTEELTPSTDKNNNYNNSTPDHSDKEINNNTPNYIKSISIDLEDVTGFIIYEDSSETKSMTPEYDTRYSLHSIKKDGKHHYTNFYFNIEDNEGKPGDEKIREELTAAVQVIPSLVTDLEKYILFSGCTYNIDNSNLSERALEIIEKFMAEQNANTENIFIIRKEDGALFNISDQPIFTYQGILIDNGFHAWENNHFPNDTYNIAGIHIPQDSYSISSKGNLFVQSGNPHRVFKIKDNDGAIDIEQMTQAYATGFDSIWSTIDNKENIYIYNYYGGELEMYLSDGKYNSISLRSILEYQIDTEPELIDFQEDMEGNKYAFFVARGSYENYWDVNGEHVTTKMPLLTGILSDGEFKECITEEIIFDSYNYNIDIASNGIYLFDNVIGFKSHRYLGYKDDSFYWHLPYRLTTLTNKYQYHYILSYNTKNKKWAFTAPADEINTILSAEYDGLAIGTKTYCFNVNESSINVTEVDLLNNSSKQYDIDVTLPSIVSISFLPYTVNSIPYAAIKGKSTDGGQEVIFTVNLLNGENMTDFGTDGRSVVSFFRIN